MEISSFQSVSVMDHPSFVSNGVIVLPSINGIGACSYNVTTFVNVLVLLYYFFSFLVIIANINQSNKLNQAVCEHIHLLTLHRVYAICQMA